MLIILINYVLYSILTLVVQICLDLAKLCVSKCLYPDIFDIFLLCRAKILAGSSTLKQLTAEKYANSQNIMSMLFHNFQMVNNEIVFHSFRLTGSVGPS